MGLDVAKGDYIAFVDSDDICKEVKLYSKDFLKLNISKANKLSIILICINKSLFKKIYQIYKRR